MLTRAARARYVAAIFLVVLVFAAFFGAYSGSSQRSPHKAENDAHAESAKNETANIFGTERADDRIARYTLWLALFTGALVVVSAIQIAYLIRTDKTAQITARAAKQSADIARDALFVGEQPYVFVTTARFSEPLDRATFNYTGPEVWPTILLPLENHGRSPAIVGEVCAESACVPSLPDVPEYQENRVYDRLRRVAQRMAVAGSMPMGTPNTAIFSGAPPL